MWACLKAEVESRYYCAQSAEKIGGTESGYFGYVSAGKHAYPDAYVPGGEVGAGGCASLTVGGKIDKEGVVGREHGSETDAQQ